MSELTIDSIIKIVLIVLLIVAVAVGLGILFKNTFYPFIQGLLTGN